MRGSHEPVFKQSTLALLLGAALSAQAAVQVGVDPQKDWVGFMNWFDLPADGGAFRGPGFRTSTDLDAQFSGSSLTSSPNTSTGRDFPADPDWWKPGRGSNRFMGANLFVVGDLLAQQSVVFSGWFSSHARAPDYSARAFIRAFSADFGTVLATVEVVLEVGKAFQVSYDALPADVHIEYGFDTRGPNARLGNTRAGRW